MSDNRQRIGPEAGWVSGVFKATAHAFAEFLALPACIILMFLLLAAGSYLLDRADFTELDRLRTLLRTHIFADPAATASLLQTVAGSLITVTSITISLLLVALQQSAATMTALVFDQFLRRRHNQFYFGFFIGLSLYALVTLATVSAPFNPIFGATLTILLTGIALCLLLVLLYTTINQTRPVEIMNAIREHVCRSRELHLDMIRQTRRVSAGAGAVTRQIMACREGYVTKIDITTIGKAAQGMPGGQAEVALHVIVGSYVACDDVIATASAGTPAEAELLARLTVTGILLEPKRDIATDPAYGVEQIAMIAWTSISPSKSNPASGLNALHTLRGIMARWSAETAESGPPAPLPVVYADKGFEQLLDAFESMAVISAESQQHQIYSEVIRTFATMYARVPPVHQARVEDLILRILSALGEHVLSRDLDSALSALSRALSRAGRAETALAVERAHRKLGESVGKLNSRSTRVGG